MYNGKLILGLLGLVEQTRARVRRPVTSALSRALDAYHTTAFDSTDLADLAPGACRAVLAHARRLQQMESEGVVL